MPTNAAARTEVVNPATLADGGLSTLPVDPVREGGEASSHDSDDGGATKRYSPSKKRRYSQEGDVEFVVRSQLTMTGGFLAESVLLNTTTVEAIEMMTVPLP